MKILNRLPLSESHSSVPTPDGIAEVKPYQIVVMVSLAPRKLMELPEGSPRFPAILDTGNNHNFSIRKEHFERWARVRIGERGRVRSGGNELPLLAGSVWIHPNQPGRSYLWDKPPFRREMQERLIIYPEVAPNPSRLPVLGLRALVRNRLKLIIDGNRREVTLKTSSWF